MSFVTVCSYRISHFICKKKAVVDQTLLMKHAIQINKFENPEAIDQTKPKFFISYSKTTGNND